MNTIPFTAVKVVWDTYYTVGCTCEEEEEIRAGFEYALRLYIERTNSVPPVEMGFDSGLEYIATGWVQWTAYDHINHSLEISLIF